MGPEVVFADPCLFSRMRAFRTGEFLAGPPVTTGQSLLQGTRGRSPQKAEAPQLPGDARLDVCAEQTRTEGRGPCS